MKLTNFFILAACLLFVICGCKQVETTENADKIIDKFNECVKQGIANNPVIGLSPETQYIFCNEIKDTASVIEAFKTIDRGITIYPNRLDHRFGKVYLANIIKDYSLSVNTIVEILSYGKNHNNQWLWDNDEEIEDVDNALKEAIHDYLYEYSTHTDNNYADQAIYQVTSVVLEQYPDWVPALNFRAVSMMNSDPNSALEMLKKTNNFSQGDVVVMLNIGNCYAQLKDKKNAIYWYNEALKQKNLDEETKLYIKQLKANI